MYADVSAKEYTKHAKKKNLLIIIQMFILYLFVLFIFIFF